MRRERCHSPFRTARGVTLVELVLVIVLLGILAGGGAMLMQQMFRSYFGAQDINNAAWQARVALERMARDLREVRAPADLTNLAALPGTAVSFTDITGTAVCFYRNGTNLMRSNDLVLANCGNTGAQRLAESVTGFDVYFLQDDGVTQTTSGAAAYYVTLRLRVVDGDSDQTLRANIHPRNF